MLKQLTIRGFKSIEKLEGFPLGNLDVLIGANGAGKSNFVELFRVLRALVEGRFQAYVLKNGPADGFFYNGVSQTKRIEMAFWIDADRYGITLEPTADGRIFIVAEEADRADCKGEFRASGLWESAYAVALDGRSSGGTPINTLHRPLAGCRVYHFYDTSLTAGMRRDVGVEQSDELEPDASNLAAFLFHLATAHPDHYNVLRKTLRRIAPYFDDFELRMTPASPQDLVRLTWRQKGSNYIFSPGHFSDGTIRFLCLATVLLQPKPPATIVLDEPELGLHPEALSVLAGLIRSASARMQVVIATQSPTFLNEFEPEQIITVDQVNSATRFSRPDAASLQAWLDDFTLGELWQKGTIRGGVNNA